MNKILNFVRSSIGRKYLMAITGFMLLGFVIVHMIGNWKLFLGADDINHYAVMLKYYTPVIWGFRLGLLTIAVIHVACAVSLVMENMQARPVGYDSQRTMQASLASITMAVSGSIVLIFIVFHILHFTVMAFNPEYHAMKTTIHAEDGIFQTLAPVKEGQHYHDVYAMVIAGFKSPAISIFYIISVGLLCLHLSHGIKSMFQSLGLNSPGAELPLKLGAIGLALVIFLGMSAVPASVLLGLVGKA